MRSSVVMDVAAFKVSHSVDSDAAALFAKDTAALRAARARSSSIYRGAMDISSFNAVHAEKLTWSACPPVMFSLTSSALPAAET